MKTKKEVNIKPNYGTTYHRDGTVSYWSVCLQQWRRIDAYSLTNRHDDFSALNDNERKQISRMALNGIAKLIETIK